VYCIVIIELYIYLRATALLIGQNVHDDGRLYAIERSTRARERERERERVRVLYDVRVWGTGRKSAPRRVLHTRARWRRLNNSHACANGTRVCVYKPCRSAGGNTVAVTRAHVQIDRGGHALRTPPCTVCVNRCRCRALIMRRRRRGNQVPTTNVMNDIFLFFRRRIRT